MRIAPPPVSAQFLAPDGRVADVWARWLRQLADKVNRESVPPGGTSGQVLEKASGGDFDTTWSTP